MNDEIKVHVVKYPDRDNLVMRYRDPFSGRQVQRTTGTKNKREAEREAGKWEAEVREGRYKARCRMTWEEFQEEYEDEKLSTLAGETYKSAYSAFNHVTRLLKPIRLADVNTARLAELQTLFRKEGMIDTTIAAHLRHLRAALNWAVRRGYLKALPTIEMPQRAKGITQGMRGRPLVEEELDRMIAKVPDKRRREPERWQRLLRGLWLGGLRLNEALALSWEEGTPISVCMAGKYPALRIYAEAEKGHRDRLLPIAPEFAELLLAVPKDERHGLVFGIYGMKGRPLCTKVASRRISSIGKAAGVITNKAKSRYATAHDLRRSFCTRWARRIMPADLNKLARHASMNTTMQFYISRGVEDMGDLLRSAMGTNSGTIPPKVTNMPSTQDDVNIAAV